MKKKIIPFIIGMLVGAIITAGGFLIYQNVNHPQGMRGDRPEGMMERRDGEEPPERPDGEKGDQTKRRDKQNTTSNTTNSTADSTSNENTTN